VLLEPAAAPVQRGFLDLRRKLEKRRADDAQIARPILVEEHLRQVAHRRSMLRPLRREQVGPVRGDEAALVADFRDAVATGRFLVVDLQRLHAGPQAEKQDERLVVDRSREAA
jgi:hypothetical protein